MEKTFSFQVHASKEAFHEWLREVELPDFSLLLSKNPEEQFTLRRRPYLVENDTAEEEYFAIDAEMKTYEEVDGQWEPRFEIIRQCVQLSIRSGEDDQLEVQGKIKAPRVIRDSLQRHLEILGELMTQAMEPPEE
jgi:hypothetical protein